MQMSMKLKKTLALVLSLVTVLSAAFTSMADVEVVEEADQIVIPEEPVEAVSEIFNAATTVDTDVSVENVEEITQAVSENGPEESSIVPADLLGGKADNYYYFRLDQLSATVSEIFQSFSIEMDSLEKIELRNSAPQKVTISGNNWENITKESILSIPEPIVDLNEEVDFYLYWKNVTDPESVAITFAYQEATLYWGVYANGLDDNYKLIISDSALTDAVKGGSFSASSFSNDNDYAWKDANIRTKISSVSFKGTVCPESTSYWFSKLPSLTEISFDGLDTSNTTDMQGMFMNSTNIKSLDVSAFVTSKVTDMSSMFANCENLTTLDLSKFNTSSVTDMSYMFYGLGLSSLDLSGFDTSNVTNMSNMFSYCKNLSALNISSFDTSNVTYMSSMFEMAGLSDISFGDGFKTGNVTDMEKMFFRSNIKELSLEGFDLGKVTTMHSLCCDCPSLESVTISSKVNTDSLTTIHQAFSGCSKLKTVTLGEGFTFKNVFFDPVWEQLTGCDMGGLFMNCGNLETVKVSESFVISEKCACYGMFENCSQLTGEKGTKASDYDFSGKEREFAHIDEGPANPGFFSALKKTLSSITVTSGPTRTSYTEGETFDPAGIVITATYGDGTTAPVTGFTFAPSGALKASDTTVTISYTEGGVTKSATVAITVSRKSDPKPVPTHDDDDREPLFTGTWNNPVKSGAWSQDSHGIWHYTSSEMFRQTWAYIYNPYAHDGQHTSDWFWFDRQGNMLTGWQFINGKWYYLHTEKDGVLGSCLIGPAVTPDGWTVDESGAWIESIPRK